MAGFGDYFRRAVMPRLLIAIFETRWPGKLRASVVRAFGGRGCIELYFAYDDPYAAIALPALHEMAARHAVRLVLYPIVERGLENDPAAEQRRRFAVTDALRLASRHGRMLTRTTPIAPDETAFLAAWTESARDCDYQADFAMLALQKLWFGSPGPVGRKAFAWLFGEVIGRTPPADESGLAMSLSRNERRMVSKGFWDSPAARVDGEWFFAHERIPQIEDRLAYLGW